MVPLIVLIGSFVTMRAFGLAGVAALNNWNTPLRVALFLMFLLTASAHWGRGRADLLRMVPPIFPRPAMLVSVTGMLEILGAIGLIVSATTRVAAVCLAILLVALFPANVRAARERLMILGRPAPKLAVRGAIQIVFLAALVAVTVHGR